MALYDLDNIVMLLSADWFLPHWQRIGILVEEGKRLVVKEGCRQVVRQIMSGVEDYYLIDFRPERVQATRSRFDALLNAYKLEQAAINRIDELVSFEESAFGTRALVVVMTEDLLSDSPNAPALDSAAREALIQVLKYEWNECHSLHEINFRQLCLASTSTWDQYLRNTHPGQPTWLADYLSTLGLEIKFRLLWGFINGRLPAKQKDELLKWYRSSGQLRTGEPVTLPDVV